MKNVYKAILYIFLIFLFGRPGSGLTQGIELTLPIGHTDLINVIKYSPSGEIVATGSLDNTIKLWDSETGELLHTLNGHVGSIQSLLFNQDGTRLLSTSNDKTAKLWDTETGKNIYTLSGHTGYVNSAWYSPDEATIITSSNDATARQWETSTGERIYTLKSHRVEINDAVWSKDSKYLFTIGMGNIDFWELPRVTYKKRLSHQGRRMVLSSDKESLIILSDNQVKWLSIPNCILTNEIHIKPSAYYDYSCKTNLLAYLEDNKKINLYNLNSGLLIKEIKIDSLSVVELLFHPDGETILVSSIISEGQHYRSRLDLWDIKDDKRITTYISDGHVLDNLTFNPNKLELTVAPSGKSFAWILDLKNNNIKHTLTGTAKKITSADFSQNNQKFLTVTVDSALKIWNYVDGKIIGFIKNSEGNFSSACFSPSGDKILTTDYSNSLKEWGLDDKKIERNYTDPSYYNYYYARYCPDKKNILAFTTDENAILWDTEKETRYPGIGKFSNNMCRDEQLFSPDGNFLLNCNGNVVKVFSIKDLKNVRTMSGGHIADITSASFSPNGKWIVTGSRDKTALIWDAHTFLPHKKLLDHSSNVIAVQFSPQSNLVITTSYDNTAKIWDVNTGKLLYTLEGSTDWNTFPCFTPDQRFIYASGSTNQIMVWETSNGRLVHVFKGHSDAIVWLYYEKEKNLLLSSSFDSKTNLWDLASLIILGTLVSVDSTDWLFLAPNGKFDGSQQGIQQLYFTKGTEVLPLELFFEKYYRPRAYSDILSRTTKQEEFHDGNIASLAPPPRVNIIHPTNGFISEKDEVEINFLADGQGSSIDEVRIFQNNKLISEQRKGVELANNQTHYTLKLVPDTNIIRIIAINRERTESIPQELSIVYKAAKQTLNLYLLAVGINDYSNPRYQLLYAQNDVEEFIQGIQKITAAIFDNIYITRLFNSSVTRDNVYQSFKDIQARAKEIDVFIFYYSGHGVMNEPIDTVVEDFYFVLHDVERMFGANEQLAEKGISAHELKDLCKNVKAQKQLIIVDACQSGGIVDVLASRGASEEKAFYQLARSAGIFVLASSSKEQTSKEIQQIKHGLFTYTLLEGLQCKEQTATSEGLIFIKPLEQFIDRKMDEYIKKFNTTPQRPMSWTFKNDFPIGTCK